MMNTLSPHNQSSETKERTGLSTGTELRLTAPQGDIGGLPQKSSVARGTTNPKGTYRARLAMGTSRVCVFVGDVCELVRDKKEAALDMLLKLCVVKHVSESESSQSHTYIWYQLPA